MGTERPNVVGCFLQVRLGKKGVEEEVLGLGPLSDYEKQGLQSLIPELKASIPY